jgi:hypothetical protein
MRVRNVLIARATVAVRAPACRSWAGASHASGMFVVTEADAAAIRTAFDHGGEVSAALGVFFVAGAHLVLRGLRRGE